MLTFYLLEILQDYKKVLEKKMQDEAEIQSQPEIQKTEIELAEKNRELEDKERQLSKFGKDVSVICIMFL